MQPVVATYSLSCHSSVPSLPWLQTLVECLRSTFVTCLVQQFLYLMSIACASLLSTAVESLTCSYSSPSFFTAVSRELHADSVLTVCSGWRYPPPQSQKKHTSLLHGDVFERVSGCLASSDKSHDFHLASFGPHSSFHTFL